MGIPIKQQHIKQTKKNVLLGLLMNSTITWTLVMPPRNGVINILFSNKLNNPKGCDEINYATVKYDETCYGPTQWLTQDMVDSNKTDPSAARQTSNITETCLFKYIEKISPPKTENFQIKNSDIFHINLKTWNEGTC